MSDETLHLKLPYLTSHQAAKHVTLNESLRALDVLVHLSVASAETANPPATPQDGDRYIVPDVNDGPWQDRSLQVAAFIDGGWLYFMPQTGWRAYVEDTGTDVVFTGDAWRIADADLRIETIGISSDADGTNRLSMASPASLFNHAGASHQLKINKATSSDTASILFQDGFSGAAEIGCVGSRDLSFKTSADGNTFIHALRVEAESGVVRLPANPRAVLNRVTSSQWYDVAERLNLSAQIDTATALDQPASAWIVPVDGIYLCAVNCTVREGENADDVRLKLQKNSDGDQNKLLEVPIADYTTDRRGSACVLTQLSQGDEVFLVFDSSNASARFRFWETRASLALL
ncbi:MAG: DUF2793 domain-containing protein [Pseudomonadota bacterium]